MNRKILALAIPNIISNITIPLLGMVDMAIVGHLGDDALIGGIAIGTAVFNFIYWNLAFLRMGTSGLAAQAYGAHDFREIAAILVRALSVALAAAMALLILQRPAGRLTLMRPNIFSHASGRPRPPSRCSLSRDGTSVCRTRASQCTSPSSST